MNNKGLQIYNSLGAQKEPFESITPGYVGMYVCGPTLYSNAHLGNYRTFISFDVIYRYLSHLGYKVRYVRNITDVGHLENDDGTGEDKISKKARLEQLEPMEIVQHYEVDFHRVLDAFNVLPPSIEPHATGHLIEQMEWIKQLIDAGFAYESQGSVYFDVRNYSAQFPYGELSGRKIEELYSETRELDGQDEKRNAQDFALWKKAAPEHIMQWPSPWGMGFPGWHIECTAMSTKYLGEQFDIHGGGMDLKFPHHEAEIAQAKGVTHKEPVKYWMHANMLTLNGQKMSKSTGNSVLPTEIFTGENPFFEKPFHPTVVRFFFLQAHYRSPLDLSNTALLAAEKGYQRLQSALEKLETVPTSSSTSFDLDAWIGTAYEKMSDDFNAPMLIAQLFDAVRIINSIEAGQESISEVDRQRFLQQLRSFMFDVLGLVPVPYSSQKTESENKALDILLDIRNEARAAKNFLLADEIRKKLEQNGIEVQDASLKK